MASLVKTSGTEVLAHQVSTHHATAGTGTVKGTAQDVSTKLSATITLFAASVQATANTNPGSFKVQVDPAGGSADEFWSTVATFTVGATTASTIGVTSIATNAITCDGTATGFASGDILYIQDVGTLTNSEWALCSGTTGSTVTCVDDVTGTFDGSDVLWNDANIFTCQLDLTSISRLRVIFENNGAVGADMNVYAAMVSGDSIA